MDQPIQPDANRGDAELLRLRLQEPGIAHPTLNRDVKRNAINDVPVASIQGAFTRLSGDLRAVVLSGEGEHFCAGLDLAELSAWSVTESIARSCGWHAAFDQVQFDRAPVIAVVHALPRIARMSKGDGLFVDSLMEAIAQSVAAKPRMRDFLDGRATKIAGEPA
jgi:hypothetical protein